MCARRATVQVLLCCGPLVLIRYRLVAQARHNLEGGVDPLEEDPRSIRRESHNYEGARVLLQYEDRGKDV